MRSSTKITSMKVTFRFIVALFFYAANMATAQDIHIEPTLAKNQFSMALLNNFGNTRYQQEFGSINNLDRLNSGHTVQFKYRYKFSKKFYAEAAWGFGAHLENHEPPIDDFGGFGFWDHEAFMHARVEFSAAYQLFKHYRNALNAKMGLGWNRFADMGLGVGYASNDERFNASYDVVGNRLPFFTLGLEYVIPTKRKDEFSFYLGYQYASNSFYRGSYSYFVGDETIGYGRFSSNLRGIQLGIGYTFTRQKRKEKIAELMSQSNSSQKDAKKKNRFERRAIDPKSRFVSVAIGIGMNRTKFSPNKNPLYGPGIPSFQHRVSYEHGWKNNLFFEFDYFGFLFWQSQFFKIEPFLSSGSAGDAFYGHFLTAGVNYKIQNSTTNFHFFNAHAGLGLGAHFYEKGMDSWGGGSMSSDVFFYDYTYVSEIRGNLMPILYVGISKDIRISERLQLNLAYRHQFGFTNVYHSEYLYSDSNNPTPRNINSKIDGTALFLQIGLKYRIK